MTEGHIKVDRKIINWEWYNDANMVHLFLHLLIKANYKTGKFQGITVRRGQLITGRLKLATVLGLTEMQIRSCLNKLKSTNEITVKVTNRFSIITVCKYDDYQSLKERDNQQDNQPAIQQITNKQPTDNQQITTIEEGKEEEERKEDNKNPLWFLKFYHSNYENYKSVFNGQSSSEKMFNEWKGFIDLIYSNKFEEIFECKFISPHDFEKLSADNKFPKEKWKKVIEDILATGVKKEHNLFFRIPKFMEYGNKPNNFSDKSPGSASRARVKALRDY